MDTPKHIFPKCEKLCGKLRVEALYKTGKRFVVWPLRVTYIPSSEPTEVLIWAPKSLFKHAVDRNRLRRQMREAYRLQKHLLGDRSYQVAFNYMDKQKQDYAVIEKAMRKALLKLAALPLPNQPAGVSNCSAETSQSQPAETPNQPAESSTNP